MGTFHNHKGDLHGITVVVDTTGSRVYVGRCDTVFDGGVVLLDGDWFDASAPPTQGPANKAQWLKRAADWGVFRRFERHIVPQQEVASITPLGTWAP